jgi:hypothetical protein
MPRQFVPKLEDFETLGTRPVQGDVRNSQGTVVRLVVSNLTSIFFFFFFFVLYVDLKLSDDFFKKKKKKIEPKW